jgi:hypothetical protein
MTEEQTINKKFKNMKACSVADPVIKIESGQNLNIEGLDREELIELAEIQMEKHISQTDNEEEVIANFHLDYYSVVAKPRQVDCRKFKSKGIDINLLVQEILTCCICKEIFKTASMTKCLHRFCHACINSSIKTYYSLT